MKKHGLTFFFLVCSLFMSTNALFAWDLLDSCSLWEDISLEARVAYYHPSSHRVRKIYKNGWADYQLELSKGFGFGCGCEKNWRVWAGVSGFSVSGRSYLSCYDQWGNATNCSFCGEFSENQFRDRTTLRMIPVSLGVKYVFNVDPCLSLYLGGAACYSFLRIRDHSNYVHEHVRKNDWGGLIQSGLYYRVTPCIYVSAFADYLFQYFHFSDHYVSGSRYVERNNLNMSGYKLGVGLGVVF